MREAVPGSVVKARSAIVRGFGTGTTISGQPVFLGPGPSAHAYVGPGGPDNDSSDDGTDTI